MRLGKLLKLSSFAVFFSLFLFSCNHPENETSKEKIPELTLSYLKVYDQEKNSNLDKELVFSVENSITTIPSEKVIAKFNYGSKTNEPIGVFVTYKNGKNSLEVGDNILILSVPASTQYKAWSKEIKVNRASSSGGATGKNLKPISLKVKIATSPIKWEFANKNGNDFTIELPSSVTSILKDDIEAYFEWDEMQAPKPRKLDFNVEGNFPIQLDASGAPKEVKMTVPVASNGEYLEFSNKLTITRKKVSDIKLKKIKLQSATFAKTEITDLNVSNEIETNSQSVNVFFYSDASAVAEDAELVNKITTEPALVKKGNLKLWNLNDVKNELQVKVDGNLVYTVKIKRNPLLVESIGVFAGTIAIDADVKEGQSYSTTASTVVIGVVPKQVANGYLTYKKVTVKAGSATEVTLSQNDPADPSKGFSGAINLTEETTPITVTIVDPTEKNEFKLTRTFTIKKEGDDPSTGPIDASVKIAELWLGDGVMDKENVNKFKAEKDANDDHKYVVHVKKSGYKDQKVALIVKGEGTATSADIKDATVTTSAKADGTSVFTSGKDYFQVKGNSYKFVFMLENGDKKAQYEVTVKFDIEVKHTLTIKKPENGEIKVYQLSGVGSAAVRTDLPVGADGTLKVKAGYTLYFELVAATGKTPKKLTIDGKEYTTVTNLPKQTSGAIAKKMIINNDFLVTGECGD